MSDRGKAILWFLIGTFGGFIILSALGVVGVLSLTTLSAILAVGFPVFALIGLGWCCSKILGRKK